MLLGFLILLVNGCVRAARRFALSSNFRCGCAIENQRTPKRSPKAVPASRAGHLFLTLSSSGDVLGPLQGVKVVSCSTAQAGTVPYMLMADLGAEVIKIEVPGKGDNSRTSSIFPGLPSTWTLQGFSVMEVQE